MTRSRLPSERGSVTLVALCFVAVLGISLAGYLAACSRAMQLSNRSFQTGVSQQLAEMGLEEGLRAFNQNDWSNWSSNPTNVSSGAWSIDSTYNRATRTITFNAGKLGQGLTGTVKIRVDNYNAAQLSSTWNSSKNYRVNELVGYNGTWYRSVNNSNTNQTPSPTNTTYWVTAPIPWAWSSYTDYRANYDAVCVAGVWYRCITSHTSSGSFAVGTNWSAMTAGPQFSWSSGVAYAIGNFVYNSGNWYRCLTNHTSTFFALDLALGRWILTTSITPFLSAPWAYQSLDSYSYDDLVYYNGAWYRYIYSTSAIGTLPTNTTYWEPALTSGTTAWSSGVNYNLGDTVYYSGTSQWYRCILAHTSSGSVTPTDTTRWTNAPLLSMAWDSGKQYASNDVVYYKGIWYLSQTSTNNYGQNPATATAYWSPTTSNLWDASTTYSAGSHRSYGGVWYRCLVGNTGRSPNDTTYWTPTWSQSSGVSTGAAVIYAEGTVNIAGGASIKTQLRAALAPAPQFPNAVAATTTINANSGGTVDSYDSDLGAYGGSNIGYSAVIAASNTSSTAITLSSTTVKGYLAAPSASTSPYAPLYSTGGSVKGASSPASPSVDLTRISRSPYIPKFTTWPSGGLASNWSTTPKGTALALATTTVIGTPGAVTPSRYYYNGNLTLGSASINTLRIVGPVILYVNGDLTISNPSTTGKIEITSTGSAEIHVANELNVTSGGDGIISRNTSPEALIIICDTTSTSDNYYSEGVNPLYGVIYVPNTTSTNGYYNNNNNTVIYGAISANKITYSGANLNVHYDTQIRYTTFGGLDQPYAISEWRELSGSEQATMP